MRIGIYAREDSKSPITDLSVGLRKLGHEAIFRRPNFFHESDKEQFDTVALLGQKPECNRRILSYYSRRKVPVLLLDYSPLQPSHSPIMRSWYMGWGSYGWLPDTIPEGANRSIKYSWLLLRPIKKKRPVEGYILYCGQVPGDAFHGLSDTQMKERVAFEIAQIREHTKRKVIFRPHPHYQQAIHWKVGADEGMPSEVGIDEALMGSWALVTVNSNSCLDAIRLGVPAFVTGVSAYSRIVNTDLSQIDSPIVPDSEAVSNFYERYSHTSWERNEFLDGSAAQFMLERMPNVI